MIHYLQYQAYVAKDRNIAVLSLDKKFFQDWFNVFDLYNFAKIIYCTTTRIPYTNKQFVKDVIGKFYVTGLYVQKNIIQLQIMFFQSQNTWLDHTHQMLGQIQTKYYDSFGNTESKNDYTLTLRIPIAEIDIDKNNNYKQLLDYVCETFTKCINQNMKIVQ